jgi:hypothetical protein
MLSTNSPNGFGNDVALSTESRKLATQSVEPKQVEPKIEPKEDPATEIEAKLLHDLWLNDLKSRRKRQGFQCDGIDQVYVVSHDFSPPVRK